MNQNHLEAEFDRVKSRLKAIAPAHCKVEEIMANVLWVLQRDEDLSRCSTKSILESVMDGLAMGLDPSGLTGEGTLIPRKTKSGGLRATFVPDYRALLRLALSHPRISHIEARVVRGKDDFTLDFGDPDGRIIHFRWEGGRLGACIRDFARFWPGTLIAVGCPIGGLPGSCGLIGGR